MNAFTRQLKMTTLAALFCLVAIGMVIAFAPTAMATTAPAESTADAPAETGSGEAKPDETKAGFTRTEALIAGLTIFVLAIFVGFEVITKVPPTLHTPLMSGSNAISGITVVGALLVVGTGGTVMVLIGLLALILATINVVGGFLVTHRMLAMFKRP